MIQQKNVSREVKCLQTGTKSVMDKYKSVSLAEREKDWKRERERERERNKHKNTETERGKSRETIRDQRKMKENKPE